MTTEYADGIWIVRHGDERVATIRPSSRWGEFVCHATPEGVQAGLPAGPETGERQTLLDALETALGP